MLALITVIGNHDQDGHSVINVYWLIGNFSCYNLTEGKRKQEIRKKIGITSFLFSVHLFSIANSHVKGLPS